MRTGEAPSARARVASPAATAPHVPSQRWTLVGSRSIKLLVTTLKVAGRHLWFDIGTALRCAGARCPASSRGVPGAHSALRPTLRPPRCHLRVLCHTHPHSRNAAAASAEMSGSLTVPGISIALDASWADLIPIMSELSTRWSWVSLGVQSGFRVTGQG